MWAKKASKEFLSVSDYLILGEVEAKASTMHLISEIETGGFTLEETCLELMRRLQHYERHASSAYKSDPEQLSIMLITILEMWQVLDTIALNLYPLLADYDPGFPSDLCYPLCVPKLADMQRLQNIEEYLKTRHDTATYPSYSLLGTLQRESFAIRYFDQCQDMQMLLADIDLADKMARVRKEKELIEKSSEYEALLKGAAETACLYTEDEFNPAMRQHNDRLCTKCFLQRKARRMRIQIHEALLPSDAIQAKAVVFELCVPQGFAAWRDTTWYILQMGRRTSLSNSRPTFRCVSIKG